MCHSDLRRVIAGLGAAVMLALPSCSPTALAADPTDGMIATASALTEEYDLPAGLLLAVAETESDFDPDCKTGKCWGLMQIHSSYAKEYAELAGLDDYDLFDPSDSMRIGAAMMDDYLTRYEGDLHFSLMCYNLGEWGARAKRQDGVQSTNYSRKVISRMDKWADYDLVDEADYDVEEETAALTAAQTVRSALSRWVEVLFK